MAGTGIRSLGKIVAAVLFISIAVALGSYIFHRRSRMRDGVDKPKLRGKLTAIANNTEYTHQVEGKVRFKLTAGTDKSYQDGSHDLENVRLESFGTDGKRDDIVTADKGKVSDTTDLTKLVAEFISNVNVVTTEELILKTDYLKYDSQKNTVETESPVQFKRKNLEGKCVGLVLEAGTEKAHLLHNVDVTVQPESAADKATSAPPAKAAKSKQAEETSGPRQKTPEQIAAKKERKRLRKLAKQKAREAASQGHIAAAPSSSPAQPAAKAKGATLSGGPKQPVHITCESALLEKNEHRVTFTDHVVVTEGTGQMMADNMLALMDDKNQLQRIEARGNCDLKQEDRGEVTGPSMDFFFDEGKRLEHAEATGGVYARSLSGEPLRESHSDSGEIFFVNSDAGNNIDTIKAHGNADLHIYPSPPKSAKDNPTDRLLKANEINMKFFPDGKDLQAADAQTNAVIVITPSRAEKGADKKTISAPRMRAQFFDEGSRIKTYDAEGGVKLEMDSMIKDQHPPRITTSKTLNATFTEDSQDIDKAIQDGDFKYEEGDRHATSDRATFYGTSQILSLRGHRPTGWDTKDRLQADEIDYDNIKNETHARGDVRSTYFNPKSTNGATPFKKSDAPIYLTADRADSRNDDSMAIYTGNAHGWQEDNFVKADRIELYQDDKRMVATGRVDSGLYNVKRETSPGHQEIVPAFATADKMTYNDTTRLVHYDGKVKSRQGTDRVNGNAVDVYLQQDSNEVDHVIAVGDVELIQPERHGWGEHLLYTASDGKAVLTGKQARVIDQQKGSTMGSELTFYSQDDRIFVDNSYGTGRVRSIHRMERGKEKP